MEAFLVTQGLGDAIEPMTKKEGKEVSSSKTLNRLLRLIGRPEEL